MVNDFAFPVIISDVIERKYDVSDTNPPEGDPKIDPTFRAAERHQPEKNTLGEGVTEMFRVPFFGELGL